ncbi:MAG: formimidoylglutamate deiminase [Planctomycetota bacterium]
MMKPPFIVEADATWIGNRCQPGVRVAVDESGLISAVGPLPEQNVHRLLGKVLLPGMINVHSHAFQRGLRGLAERFPRESGDFWSWRESMYRLAEGMDADTIYEITRRAFTEMLAAGITTVGEFHYLHHDASCNGFAFDDIILQAAHDAGIRLVLLNSFYKTGGIGRPLIGGQKRFTCDSVAELWKQVDRLERQLRNDRQSLAVAPHSIRAVPLEDLISLRNEATRRDMVCHIHVEEQTKEIDDCLSEYAETPMSLVNRNLNVDPTFTAIHCTHTATPDLTRFLEGGGNVCLCPTTEGNLGDGFPDSIRMNESGAICIGTDSNTRICLLEDLRWLEGVQRLQKRQRGILTDREGSNAKPLFDAVTVNGARSLGLQTGKIEPGFLADFIAVELTSPPLIGCPIENLLEALIFGCGDCVISDVCVGGRWVFSRSQPSH